MIKEIEEIMDDDLDNICTKIYFVADEYPPNELIDRPYAPMDHDLTWMHSKIEISTNPKTKEAVYYGQAMAPISKRIIKRIKAILPIQVYTLETIKKLYNTFRENDNFKKVTISEDNTHLIAIGQCWYD